MISRIITGNMHVFGNNIDTDQIYPGQYLDVTDHQEMASHCLQGASDKFAKEFVNGDIVVAGTNFGCGSSRENAAIALKVRGVGAVIAKSFARIFYRNAFNLGLPLIVCPEIDKIANQGDQLVIDMDKQLATNTRTGQTANIEPISEYAMKLLNAGGIKSLLNPRRS
jgi:3-isopropylmalate/(R)-2-methylmalate dehydratase small subunit